MLVVLSQVSVLSRHSFTSTIEKYRLIYIYVVSGDGYFFKKGFIVKATMYHVTNFPKDKNKLSLLTFLTFTLKECAHVPIGVLKIIISLQSNNFKHED